MTDYYELHKGKHVGWRDDELRPGWLADDDVFEFSVGFSWVAARGCTSWSDLDWSVVKSLRLRSDHWAVEPLKRGMRPHAGSGKAPDDWDKGDVLRRGGGGYSPKPWIASYVNNQRWCWVSGTLSHNDIIGYTPKPSEPTGWPEELTPELAERMVENLREFAEHTYPADVGADTKWGRCLAILAELEPADPLVEEIRDQLGPKFKHFAEVVAQKYRAENEK